MRTRAKQKTVASDRARRENVLKHILSYMYFRGFQPEALNIFSMYDKDG